MEPGLKPRQPHSQATQLEPGRMCALMEVAQDTADIQREGQGRLPGGGDLQVGFEGSITRLSVWAFQSAWT